jgi:hypothetical protein
MPQYNANAGSGVVNALVPAYHAPSDMTDTGTGTGICFPCNTCVFNQGGNTIGKNLSPAMPDGTSNVILFATGTTVCSNTSRSTGFTANSSGFFGVGPAFSNGNVVASTQGNAVLFQVPGTSNTNASATACGSYLPSNGGTNSQWQAYGAGGIGVCMGDANTRQISPSVSGNSWRNAIWPNDSNNPGSDF